VITASHLDIAKALGGFPDLSVIRGHDHFGQRASFLTSFDDMLDERFAGDFVQRLTGKTCGCIPRGDDTDDFHASG